MSSDFHSIGVLRARASAERDHRLLWRGVRLAHRRVIQPELRDEVGLVLLAQQAGGHRNGAAGVEHVDDRLAVVGGDLDGGMRAAGGCAADEQRQLELQALHLAGDVHHFVERGRDEAAEPDQVGLLGFGAFEDLLRRDHDAHVDHFVVIAGEHDADDVLADVVDVALHRGEHDLSLGFHFLTGRDHRCLLRFHERSQPGDRLFHHACRLHDLGKKHFAGAEEIADHAHAIHERAFDHRQRAPQFLRAPPPHRLRCRRRCP